MCSEWREKGKEEGRDRIGTFSLRREWRTKQRGSERGRDVRETGSMNKKDVNTVMYINRNVE